MARIKKGKKVLLTLVSVFGAIIVSLGIFLSVWFWGDTYEDFKSFNKEFAIAGLNDDFIPQGLGNNTDNSVYFISGYMKDGSASRIYVVDNSGEEKYITMQYEDGTEYAEHCCGVASNGVQVWLASPDKSGTGKVFIMSYTEVLKKASKDGGTVKFVSSFDANCGADFCYYESVSYLGVLYGNFYVGEFYREGNYETDPTHQLLTPNGTTNRAVYYKYSVTALGILSNTPEYAVSIPEKIQGMAVYNGLTVLSQSYGLANSHMLIYEHSKAQKSTFTVQGKQIDLYYYDSSCLHKDLEIPSMSEGLCNYNNKVYVLFENAGAKYKMFTREKLTNVYSFEIN